MVCRCWNALFRSPLEEIARVKVDLQRELHAIIRALVTVDILALTPNELTPHHHVVHGLVKQIDLRDLPLCEFITCLTVLCVEVRH